MDEKVKYFYNGRWHDKPRKAESGIMDGAKERVEKELSELLDKIANLSIFLHQNSLTKKGLSMRMIATMYTQLTTMTDYARLLQCRLSIWGKTDEEIEKARGVQA